MKFLNSFLFVVFLLFAICAVLCFARPNGSPNNFPIELEFFEHEPDNCDCQKDGPCYDKWQSNIRFHFEKVSEDSQGSDGDKNVTIRYVFGQRHENDTLINSDHQINPNFTRIYPGKRLHWRSGNNKTAKWFVAITAMELNVTLISLPGQESQKTPSAYLIPDRNQLYMGFEEENLILGYKFDMYGFFFRRT